MKRRTFVGRLVGAALAAALAPAAFRPPQQSANDAFLRGRQWLLVWDDSVGPILTAADPADRDAFVGRWVVRLRP